MQDFLLKLIESYNSFINQTSAMHIDTEEYDFDSIMRKSSERWGEEFCNILGATPAEAIAKKLGQNPNKQDVVQCYETLVLKTSGYVPFCAMELVKGLGDAGIEYILNIMDSEIVKKDVNYSELTDGELQAQDLLAAALQTAPYLNDKAVNAKLIEIYNDCLPSNDIFLDFLGNAFVALNMFDEMEALLDKAEAIENKEHSIMNAIVSSKIKNDGIFRSLKKSFKKPSSNKFISAMLLADYGDPRAIAVLRKYAQDRISQYAEMKEEKMSAAKAGQRQSMGLAPKDEINIIFTMISSLGGDVSDMTNGF